MSPFNKATLPIVIVVMGDPMSWVGLGRRVIFVIVVMGDPMSWQFWVDRGSLRSCSAQSDRVSLVGSAHAPFSQAEPQSFSSE